MTSREKVTSAFAPDLDEVRAWLQKMIATPSHSSCFILT
jgi:hypothetical protein